MSTRVILPDDIGAALATLNAAGFEAAVVGGCVRDSLLGRAPSDWDIATSAAPQEVKRVFAGYRVVETGLKHGTVTVLFDSSSIEITTYRVDGVYSDDPRDISNMDYPAFLEAYRTAIRQACDRLKPNRFAVFVVGDVRDKKGIYRNFVGHTIDAFTDAGIGRPRPKVPPRTSKR